MTPSGVGHPDRMAPSLSSLPKLGLPRVQSILRRFIQSKSDLGSGSPYAACTDGLR